MSPGRALRLGLARAAAQLYELPLQVTEVKSSVVGLDAVAGACGEEMLLALLDGPEGARGAVGLSRAMVAALIEVQVMGVVSTLEVRDRVLTPTDAAMVAPWLDGALERVDRSLEEEPAGEPGKPGKDNGWMIGYRFGAMAEEPRALALALDAARFHMLRLTVDVALGRRIGEVVLLLPAPPMAESATHANGGAQAGESFLQVPAELRVIAGRLSLPLSRAGALQPGDVLPLEGLQMATAELRSVDGSLAGKAHLGRMGDHWAVRFGPAAAPAKESRAEPARIAAAPVGGAMGQGTGSLPQVYESQPGMSGQGALPDLPPMDFDDPPGAEGALMPLGTSEDLGNAGFE